MSRKSLNGRILLAGAALIAIGAGGSAVALATSSASGQTYTGCLTRSGSLYNVHVNPRHRPHCQRGSKRMSWNQTGPIGPQGPPGPQGPQGPSGASPTISGTVVSSTNISVPAGSAGTSVLPCPIGDIASGGGGGFQIPGTTDPTGLAIQDSEPTFTAGSPTGWQVIAVNTTANAATFSEYAVCLGATAQSHLAQRHSQIHEPATVRLTPVKR